VLVGADMGDMVPEGPACGRPSKWFASVSAVRSVCVVMVVSVVAMLAATVLDAVGAGVGLGVELTAGVVAVGVATVLEHPATAMTTRTAKVVVRMAGR